MLLTDHGGAGDVAILGQCAEDKPRIKATWRVRRAEGLTPGTPALPDDQCPYGDWEDLGENLLTTVGATDLWKGLIGTAFTVFSNANAYIGVGDSSTTATAGDTDLNASSNKLRVGMDSTYPSISGASCVFRATFSTSQANYAWNEWGIFNASSSGDMLNHKVQGLGTKVNTAQWQLQCTLTLG